MIIIDESKGINYNQLQLQSQVMNPNRKWVYSRHDTQHKDTQHKGIICDLQHK